MREEIEKAERPDPRLERDLADAIAHLEAVKAKNKAKSKKKAVKVIRAELIEAKKEADQALKVETEAKRDTREAKKTADASRQGTSTYIHVDLVFRSMHQPLYQSGNMFPTWKIRNRNAPSTQQI